jgi:hypothetical protein
MAEQIKVEYSVDFDDEWLQEDCHWKYDRFFILTWKIWSGDITNINTGEVSPGISYSYNNDDKKRKLYYRIGTGNNVQIYSYKTTVNNNAKWGEGLTRKLETFTYRLNLSSIDIDKLLAARTPEGWLPITLYTEITDDSSTPHKFKEFTYDYYLKLPPSLPEILPIELVTNNPGEVKCTWNQPEETYSCDDAEGYCIEIFHCPEKESEFTKLDGLRWNEASLGNGKYYIEKIPDYKEVAFTEPTTTIDEDTEITFVAKNPKSELFIWKPIEKPENYKPEFYFMPKELDIKPGDKYLFRVYPYNVYSAYLDENSLPQPSSFLTNEGATKESKVSKGVVRVRTSSGWVEGQVWVCTEKGWTMAESVYTKTETGWKEAI